MDARIAAVIEWNGTGIVIGTAPIGEGDAVLAVLTEDHGLHRGLVRGAASRRNRAAWEIGNVVGLTWRARLADQLGTFTGEPVGTPYAAVADQPLHLAILASSCAVARRSLPERSACPDVFAGLLLLLARLGVGQPAPLALLVRWEVTLLAELGFGLSLDRCGVNGSTRDLPYVSPRTGRAVSRSAAVGWEERLLRLPAFLTEGAADVVPRSRELSDGLALTGHFLSREVFEARNLDLPASRLRLASMVQRLAAADHQAAVAAESPDWTTIDGDAKTTRNAG